MNAIRHESSGRAEAASAAVRFTRRSLTDGLDLIRRDSPVADGGGAPAEHAPFSIVLQLSVDRITSERRVIVLAVSTQTSGAALSSANWRKFHSIMSPPRFALHHSLNCAGVECATTLGI